MGPVYRTSRDGQSTPLGRCNARVLAVSATFVVAGAVVACAATTARTAVDYDRGNAAQAQFLKDAEGCAKEAEAHQKEFGYGQYDPTRGPYNRLYDACMQSHGYARKPVQ